MSKDNKQQCPDSLTIEGTEYIRGDKATRTLIAPKGCAYTDWVGEGVFVRTATYHLIGRLDAVYPEELVLSNVSTVFSSGSFGAALARGTLSEAEAHPVGAKTIVPRGAIIDVNEWLHLGV